VVSALASINVATLGPVSTWMGDRLRAGKPSKYVTSHLGQFSLPSLRGRSIIKFCFWCYKTIKVISCNESLLLKQIRVASGIKRSEIFESGTDFISLPILFFLYFLLGRHSSEKPPRSVASNCIGMKFGRIALQVNTHRLMESDIWHTRRQNGGRTMQQRPSAARCCICSL